MNEYIKEYTEIKEIIFESFNEYYKQQKYTIKQAMAVTLEESVLLMKESKVHYNMVIVSMMLIAINNNSFPAYIFDRFKKINPNLLKGDVFSLSFINDYKKIKNEIEQHTAMAFEQFEFDLRVSMLLEEI